MSSDDLFEEAARLEDGGDIRGALAIWRALGTTHPNPIVLCRLANAAEDLGETEEARGALRLAIALDPDCGHAYEALASMALDAREYENAEQFLREVLRIGPVETTYSLLGIALSALGRDEEAQNSYLKALEIDPGFDEAHYNLGVLAAQTDPAEAERLFGRALELTPDYAEAHRELGRQLARRNSLDDAEAHLRTAIGLQPDDAWAHIYLGNLLWRRGCAEDAITEFGWAREAAPEWAVPLWATANVYEDREEWETAQGWYERALALEPGDAITNMNFGRMLNKKGDLVAAKEYLGRALMIDPGYSAARDLLLQLRIPGQ